MERKSIVKAAIGLVLGIAIGTGLGILVAPRKGSKTRKKIKHGVSNAKSDASDWLTDAKDDLVKTAKDKKKAFDKRMA